MLMYDPHLKRITILFKKNYRPIRILQNLIEAYERLMYDQKYPFFYHIFPNLQGGFCVGPNKECLTQPIEEWSKCLDNGVYDRALLL